MHALVIRTSILKENRIRLDEHCFYVDVEYILYPVPYVETVIYYDIFVYMYRLAQAAQSVSILGYQKHIQNHIDVIFHVLDYINEYKRQPGYDLKKADYMAMRIAEMTHDQVDIFTSFPVSDRSIRGDSGSLTVQYGKKALTYMKSPESTAECSGFSAEPDSDFILLL